MVPFIELTLSLMCFRRKNLKKIILFILFLFLISACIPPYNISPTASSNYNQSSTSILTPLSSDLTYDTALANLSGKWDLWSMGKTTLRGANIWQALVVPEIDGDSKGSGRVGPPFLQKDFDQLAEAGANYVVLSIPGLFTENPPYQVDQAVQENLDNLLTMAARADLFVTIAFRTGPGRAEWSLCCKDGPWYDDMFNDTVWEDVAAQSAWVEMWQYTARRYKENPIIVGYELMVEPDADDILLGLDDPNDFYPSKEGSLYDWNQLYPKIVSAIREVDSNTPIIIGGMGYSSITWLPYLQQVSAEKIIFDFHQYLPYTHYTHQNPSGQNTYSGQVDVDEDGFPEKFDFEWLEDFFKPAIIFSQEQDIPLCINEFGIKRWVPGAAKYIQDQIGIFEENGWNYAIWEWSTSYPPFGENITDFNFRLGVNPDNRSNLLPNQLWDVIQFAWNKNFLRPSMIKWNQ